MPKIIIVPSVKANEWKSWFFFCLKKTLITSQLATESQDMKESEDQQMLSLAENIRQMSTKIF